MPSIRKDLIVVGDRILIQPQEGDERTGTGLYLPATAVSEQEVRSGKVVKVGPGTPIAEPAELDEPWKKKQEHAPRYVPVQAKAGDTAIFLKKAAVEIRYDNQRYLVVPMGAVLLLAREELNLDSAFPSPLDDLGLDS